PLPHGRPGRRRGGRRRGAGRATPPTRGPRRRRESALGQGQPWDLLAVIQSSPMATPAQAAPSPAHIAAVLGKRVLGQADAVREVSVALAKKLANLHVGNILLIGSSGS